MLQPDERQEILDEEHLRLLRIAYLIHGGTYTALSVLPLIYVPIGLVILLAPPESSHGHPPRALGVLFMAIGFGVAIAVALFGALQLYAARCLRLRRSRGMCLFAAVVACLQIPLGTALGVFTFVVLGRDSVRRKFDSALASAPMSSPISPSAAPPLAP